MSQENRNAQPAAVDDDLIDIDAECLQKPLRFKLNGKKYTVGAITPETLDSVVELSGGGEKRKVKDVLPQQLAILTGADKAEFESVDVRKLTTALKHVMRQLSDPDAVREGVEQAKNESGA
jgi:hypothetical protein